MIKKLATYEDLEEQGLLVRLPCKEAYSRSGDFQKLETIEINENGRINMKPEEALKELSYDDTAYGGKCTYEVRKTAIDALEKQIPCKPEEYVPDFPYNIFSTQKCAKCGTPVIGKKISKYCSECGQKIDWGEE